MLHDEYSVNMCRSPPYHLCSDKWHPPTHPPSSPNTITRTFNSQPDEIKISDPREWTNSYSFLCVYFDSIWSIMLLSLWWLSSSIFLSSLPSRLCLLFETSFPFCNPQESPISDSEFMQVKEWTKEGSFSFTYSLPSAPLSFVVFLSFSTLPIFSSLSIEPSPSSLSSSLPITQPTTSIHKIQIRWMIKIMSSHRKAKKKTVTEWWNDNEENTRLESRVKKLFRRVNRDVLEASIGSPINSVTRNSHSRALWLCVSSFKKAFYSNSLENVLQSSAHPLDLWMKMGENRCESTIVLRLSLCSSTLADWAETHYTTTTAGQLASENHWTSSI